MSFMTDQQTLTDLNIQGKFKAGSMFNLFNRVKTKGGEKLLEKLFRSPLTDAVRINQRAAKIKYVQSIGLTLDIDAKLVRLADEYTTDSKSAGRLSSLLLCCKEKVQEMLYHSEHFALQKKRMKAVVNMVKTARNLSAQLSKAANKKETPAQDLQDRLAAILNETAVNQLTPQSRFTFSQTVRYRYLIENKCRTALAELLEILYRFDVYVSVASVAASRQLTYPIAQDPGETDKLIHVENGKHPTLSGAVGNDLTLKKDKNLLFLTGANMAGKSTLMKTLGVSVYLAHMGFPLAADGMTFAVMDGIYSSINVKDDISRGWSHFYSEVMRMKQIAQKLTEGHRLFVLFDEMYKSTNVKDAYDATLAISKRLAKYGHCCFVISTHIIEVGEELKDTPNVMFRYLPTVMEGSVPHYTYDLTEGITDDRQGMIIVENEGILDMLESKK